MRDLTLRLNFVHVPPSGIPDKPAPFVTTLKFKVGQVKEQLGLASTVVLTDIRGNPLPDDMTILQCGLKQDDEVYLRDARPEEIFEAVPYMAKIAGTRRGFRRVDSASGLAFGDTHHLAWITPHPYPWQFGVQKWNEEG